MDAWKNAFFLQDKAHVHKIPRFRRGVFWVLGILGKSLAFGTGREIGEGNLGGPAAILFSTCSFNSFCQLDFVKDSRVWTKSRLKSANLG